MRANNYLLVTLFLACSGTILADGTNTPVSATNTIAAVTNVAAVAPLCPPSGTNPVVVPPGRPGSVPAIGQVVRPPVATNPPVQVTPQPAPAKGVASPPDPQVGRVLLALAAHLQSSKRFRCEVSFLIASGMEGMKQEISATYALAAEKPNKLALRHVKGMTGNTVVCDGKKLLTYAPVLNRYEEREAPQTFEQLSQGVGPMSGNMLFVDNLLRNDVYAAIMDGVTKVTYAGKQTVEGRECDHLKFEQEQFDWELWVTPDVKPVIVQVLSDMTKGLSAMTGEGIPNKGMTLTVLNRFAKWDVDGVLPSDTFQFALPPGAKKADSLFEGDEDAMPVTGEK